MGLSALIIPIIFFSGDFISAIKYEKKFGEVTPISVLANILFLYICGILNCLTRGVCIIIVFTASCYIAGFFYLIFNRSKIHAFKHNFFSSVFFLTLITFLILIWGDYGQLATTADDLGHWMDCIKSMTYSGVLYPHNHSIPSDFPTYPPLVSLLQYEIQIIYLSLFKGGFNEWLMFLTFHMMMLALMLPFIASLNNKSIFKKKRSSVLFMYSIDFIILLSPTVLFPTVFERLMIDPFLSVITAVLFLTIVKEPRDVFSDIYICLLIPSIILSKDIGLLFSCFGLLLFFIIVLLKKRNPIYFIICILGSVIAKISWKYVILVSEVKDPKPDKVIWLKYLRVLIGVDSYSENYKNESVNNYRKALFTRTINVGSHYIRFQLNYMVLILVLAILFIIISRYVNNSSYYLLGIINILMLVCFWIGLGGVYVDKFIYTEAISLASFERYFNSIVAVFMICMMMMIAYNVECLLNTKLIIIIITLFIISLPYDNIKWLLHRDIPHTQQAIRSETDRLSDDVLKTCKSNSKIYLISQDETGWRDYLSVRFNLRPYISLQSTANNDYNWHFVYKRDPKDIYSKEMTPNKWKDELFYSEDYDYVVIAKSDSYFKNHFYKLFGTRDVISDGGIYIIDKDNKRLLPCNK